VFIDRWAGFKSASNYGAENEFDHKSDIPALNSIKLEIGGFVQIIS
jgi:hypothetical protein